MLNRMLLCALYIQYTLLLIAAFFAAAHVYIVQKFISYLLYRVSTCYGLLTFHMLNLYCIIAIGTFFFHTYKMIKSVYLLVLEV